MTAIINHSNSTGASTGFTGGAVRSAAATAAGATNSSGVYGIRRSFESTRRVVRNPVGGSRPIAFGDKVFARVMMGGKTILEFMADRVNDLSELYGELRSKCRGMRGLVKLYIRNMSRGWSIERPLMFYSDPHAKRNPRVEAYLGYDTPDYPVYSSCQPSPRQTSAERVGYAFRGQARQLSFPF